MQIQMEEWMRRVMTLMLACTILVSCGKPEAPLALLKVQTESSIADNYLDSVVMDHTRSMTDALQGKE
jgi:hypothetical protein